MSKSEEIRMWKRRLQFARMRRQAALTMRYRASKDKSDAGVSRCTAWLEREMARIEEAMVALEGFGINFEWRR